MVNNNDFNSQAKFAKEIRDKIELIKLTKTPKQIFDDMVNDGIIDKDGKVIMNRGE